jgi:cell division protein FtsI/penicillin-binding protein 2
LDEIDIDDFYDDDGEATLTVWWGIEYTIRNVSSSCLGTNTYLNALIYSCNVGMIDIIRQIGKEPYYNYLEKLGFGTTTNIELAWEEPWFIEEANTASLSRFFNNSFGLGLRATPIQMAQSFATLINGWLLIQPTIIDRLYDPNTDTYDINEPTVVRRVFKKETADQIGGSLFTLVDENPVTKENVAVAWFSLGGKTGTSEIPFRGRYLGNEWRTNTSFIGVVTQDNPNYIIVVQIRRPRTSRWWAYTAAPLFQDIAEFIIAYDLIQS